MRTTTKGLLLFSSSSLIVLASYLAACGGDDSSSVSGDDAGADTSSSNPPPTPPPNPPPPPPPTDGGTDGSACAVDNAACTTDQGAKGLCKAGACSPCADPGDDQNCKTAYAGTLCIQGVCATADCRQNADCTGGKICGATTPNTCGSCTSDTACKTAYGTDYVCNTTTGGCITNAMACTVSSDAGACLGNANDVCCVPSGGAAGACVPGNCCSDVQCVARDATKPLCVNNTCTSCPAVADGKYYVDTTVSTAQDAIASGVNNPTTCAFKTLTHALAAIGTGKAAAVQVIIRGDGANSTLIGAGETFPIIVPPYVTITSEDTAHPATIQVPSGKDGFVLSYANSGLDHVVVDGQSKVGQNGVIAQTGSSSTTTTLNHVKVQNFAGEGIIVTDAAGKTTGGGLAVGAGVISTGNGQRGLLVTGHGVAVVNVPSGDAAHFDNNGEAGIRVSQTGQLTLTGAVGATPPTTGTVTTSSNGTVGLAIDQVPGTVPANVITGLTAWSNTASGIRISAGSQAKLRSSSSLKNGASGVHVRFYTTSTGTIVDDTSKIDLGANNAGDPGKNVLQDVNNLNTGVGICLDIEQNKGQILNAYGNSLVTKAVTPANVDCSTTAAQISKSTGAGACTVMGGAVGVTGAAVNTNQIIALQCTQ